MSGREAFEIFRQQLGEALPPSDWIAVDQTRIDQFADATDDRNFIHVDPEASAQGSPYGVTIAHGFLTLSLLSHLTTLIPAADPDPFAGALVRINYGLNRVRFVCAVKVDSRIRARWKPVDVVLKDDSAVHVTYDVTIDIEHEKRPACVAEWILRLVY